MRETVVFLRSNEGVPYGAFVLDEVASTQPSGEGVSTQGRIGATAPGVRRVSIASVLVSARRIRTLGDVAGLMDSISVTGLLQPIVVDNALRLICGLHRLEACKRLGWTEIPALIHEESEARVRIAEIDENLCRRELSALERAEHLAMRRRLWEEIAAAAQRAAAVPPPAEGTKKPKKAPKKQPVAEPPLEAFLAETERRTGRGRSIIKQELKIGELPEDVRELARETMVRDNKRELLALTKMPAQEQLAALERVKTGTARSVRPAKPKPEPVLEHEDEEAELEGISNEPTREEKESIAIAASQNREQWSVVGDALERVVRSMEQAVGVWPDDLAVTSDADGNAGRATLQDLLTTARSMLRTVRSNAGM